VDVHKQELWLFDQLLSSTPPPLTPTPLEALQLRCHPKP